MKEKKSLPMVGSYVVEIIIGAFILLFLCWMAGYWGNALLGTNFDLKSCWDGFTTLGGAGILAVVKYIMDSMANSVKGEYPYERR